MIFLKAKLRKLRRQSTPDATFKAALRTRLLADQTAPVVYCMPIMRYTFATTALVLVLVFGVGSYAYASSSVTDGDLLYPVKTGIENVEGSFAKTPEARARFRAKMLDRRAREITYRLRHGKPLRPRDAAMLARVMNMSVDQLRELKNDDAARESAKAELKTKMIDSLTTVRARVESSTLSDEQKQVYLEIIDDRMAKVQEISTTAPQE